MSSSSTTTEKWPPVHPGEILMEDFLKGFGITQNKLAVSIGVPPRRINEIVHGQRRITADTALRLGRYFAMDPQFWINLQSHYDLQVEGDALGGLPRRHPAVADRLIDFRRTMPGCVARDPLGAWAALNAAGDCGHCLGGLVL